MRGQSSVALDRHPRPSHASHPLAPCALDSLEIELYSLETLQYTVATLESLARRSRLYLSGSRVWWWCLVYCHVSVYVGET